MKDCTDPMQSHSQPRSPTFRKLSACRYQHALDVLPGQICARRLSVDGFEGALMLALHKPMISFNDIAVKNALRFAWEAGSPFPVVAVGRAWILLESRKNSKPEKCSKKPQNPHRPLHALFGGSRFKNDT